ncbi:MAG: LuxR C-terminal-related transcriptional regulator [Bacteroidota bacterium]
MKQLIVLLFALVLSDFVLASDKFDSMLIVAKNPNITGDAKVKVYLWLAGHSYKKSPPKAIAYLDTASSIVNSQGARKYEAKLQLRYATYYKYNGEFRKALACINKLETMFATAISGIDSTDEQAVADLTIKYRMASCYFEAAEIHRRIGDFEKSLFYYLKQKEAYEKNPKVSGAISAVYNNMGVSYFEGLEDFESAKYYYFKSLKINLETSKNPERLTYGLDRNITNNYANIGEVYAAEGKYDSAKYYTVKAYKRTVANRPNDKDFMSFYATDLGYYYLKAFQYDSALFYLQKAFDIQIENKYSDYLNQTKLDLARVYRQQQNFDKSIKLADEVFRDAVHKNIFRMASESADLLSNLYIDKSEYKDAVSYLKKYQQYRDSSVSVSKNKEIARLHIQFDVADKERENDLLKKEAALDEAKIQNQINVSIALAVIILLLIFSILMIYKRVKIKQELSQQKLKNEQAQKQILQSELKSKNKELINFALQIVEKNDFMSEITTEVDRWSKTRLKEDNNIKDLSKKLKANKFITKHQLEFDAHVNSVYESFYTKLEKKFDGLTQNEKRLAVLLRLGLSSKEISSITGIASKSVDMNRYRLRKKLNLETEENLISVLNMI